MRMINAENQKVNNLINEYENLESIHASDEWEQQLFTRITVSQSNYASKKELIQFATFIIVFIILNASIFFRVGKETDTLRDERIQLLNSVSDQLLINTTALK